MPAGPAPRVQLRSTPTDTRRRGIFGRFMRHNLLRRGARPPQVAQVPVSITCRRPSFTHAINDYSSPPPPPVIDYNMERLRQEIRRQTDLLERGLDSIAVAFSRFTDARHASNHYGDPPSPARSVNGRGDSGYTSDRTSRVATPPPPKTNAAGSAACAGLVPEASYQGALGLDLGTTASPVYASYLRLTPTVPRALNALVQDHSAPTHAPDDVSSPQGRLFLVRDPRSPLVGPPPASQMREMDGDYMSNGALSLQPFGRISPAAAAFSTPAPATTHAFPQIPAVVRPEPPVVVGVDHRISISSENSPAIRRTWTCDDDDPDRTFISFDCIHVADGPFCGDRLRVYVGRRHQLRNLPRDDSVAELYYQGLASLQPFCEEHAHDLTHLSVTLFQSNVDSQENADALPGVLDILKPRLPNFLSATVKYTEADSAESDGVLMSGSAKDNISAAFWHLKHLRLEGMASAARLMWFPTRQLRVLELVGNVTEHDLKMSLSLCSELDVIVARSFYDGPAGRNAFNCVIRPFYFPPVMHVASNYLDHLIQSIPAFITFHLTVTDSQHLGRIRHLFDGKVDWSLRLKEE
ncbi:hypothetical protein HDZ31DRAFT_59522 [Schizophyllum fasciatum]